MIIEESTNGTWKDEFNDGKVGMHYTRESAFNLSTKFDESYSIEMIDDVADLTIVLHDPNYFMINTNPATIPRLDMAGEKEEPFTKLFYLEVTLVQKLNVPTNPCEETIDYNYQKCIGAYIIGVIFRGNVQEKRVYLKTLSKQLGGWSRPFQNFFKELIFDIRWGLSPY